MDETKLAIELTKLLGSGTVAVYLLFKWVLPLVDQRGGYDTRSTVRLGNGAAGEQGVNFWVEKCQTIVKNAIEEQVLPPLNRVVGLVENAGARTILMDAETRAIAEAHAREITELRRQVGEVADMVRQRHERDAASRAKMETVSMSLQRDVADLNKMLAKLLDRGN